jgi:TPR repeat protein
MVAHTAKGVGVPKDLQKAAAYYRRLHGDGARGCEHLAWCYYSGEGVLQDRKVALQFYEKACSLGAKAACKVRDDLRSSR